MKHNNIDTISLPSTYKEMIEIGKKFRDNIFLKISGYSNENLNNFINEHKKKIDKLLENYDNNKIFKICILIHMLIKLCQNELDFFF